MHGIITQLLGHRDELDAVLGELPDVELKLEVVPKKAAERVDDHDVEGRGRLLATARRLLGNDHDAQDAVQETFISAFNSIASFRGDARLSTWLHRIVVNAALVQLRHRRRWSEVAIHDLLPRFEGDGCWAEGTELSSGAVEHLTVARDTREAVRRCIARLPAIYRSVLVLRDIEELDTGEVGRMLAINVNTVKIRLHRARQALKSLLDRENSLL